MSTIFGIYDLIPTFGSVLVIGFLALCLVVLSKGVQIVPQSLRYTVERFGRFTRTLDPGLAFIVPFLDRVAHRVSILERQLEQFSISVITRDNVEIDLVSTVFFRITDPGRTMYRIADIEGAIYTTATSVVRSAAGKLELDDIQSSRDNMNREIADALRSAAEEWGVEVTRTEVLDVKVDEQTKDAQRRQLNAERERRAIVAKAEGDRESIQLAADGELYQAQKRADAVRLAADAEAYAIEKKAAADAKQTQFLADAIAANGQPAVDFEIRKRQVQAISELAAAGGTRTLVLPAEVAGVLGSLDTLTQLVQRKEGGTQ